MELAFLDEQGALFFLDALDEVPRIGEVFELSGSLKNELPGIYLAAFIESYMFSDLITEDSENYDEEAEETKGLAFVAIALREVSNFVNPKKANYSVDSKLQDWEAQYEEISDTLDGYIYGEEEN